MKTLICFLVAICCVAMVAITTRPVIAHRATFNVPAAETYTGTIVGIGGTMGGRTRSFTLTIDGTTPDADITNDIEILAGKGQDGLLDAIRKQRLGRFSIAGQVGRDVNVVRIRQVETGRKITILFERWLQLYEVRAGTRSQDYPFTYAELVINAEGKGQGTLIPAAKIRFDKDEHTVEIENFGIYPAMLSGVQKR